MLQIREGHKTETQYSYSSEANEGPDRVLLLAGNLLNSDILPANSKILPGRRILIPML